jgi:hypothetical protein
MFEGERFIDYTNHHLYWLEQDSLRPFDSDLYFSPMNKYTCRANCQVCYIKDELKEGFSQFSGNVPDKITTEMERRWFDFFEFFYELRTNDDFTFLKLNHKHIYDWYVNHANLFGFCMTDNALIIHHKTLMKDITVRELSDISLSESFLLKANKDHKILNILKDYQSKYVIKKIKVIRTSLDTVLDPRVQEIIDWLVDNNMHNSLQSNLLDESNPLYDANELDYQNTYVFNYKGKIYQIYREAIQLYNDRFYYSINDATNIHLDTFYKLPDGPIDINELIYYQLTGKQQMYKQFSKEMAESTDPRIIKYRDYFETVNKFTINKDFNFIPAVMLKRNTKFLNQLVDKYGYVITPAGIIRPNKNDSATSIVIINKEKGA